MGAIAAEGRGEEERGGGRRYVGGAEEVDGARDKVGRSTA